MHTFFLHENPDIALSNEHTEHRFFSQSEILCSYQDFSSGPLWEFFTFLKFQESGGVLQEGMLKDIFIWLGKSYVD